MAKRFNDTDIWKKQRWFRKLSPEHKLAFCYIKDQCDHAGIWNIDCSDLIDDLGFQSFDVLTFAEAINTEYDKITGDKIMKDRVIFLTKTCLWVTGFIQFQYEGKDKLIKATNNMVKGALFILDSIKFNPWQPLATLGNPYEGLTVLEYAINAFHIKANEGLAVLRQGLATLKEKERDNVLVKHKTSENGKQVVNFKAQGENLFADRDKKHRDKATGL